ncbi:MAG: hypothetical protein ACLP01_18345 [Solirubrobacteraceae bacterium]
MDAAAVAEALDVQRGRLTGGITGSSSRRSSEADMTKRLRATRATHSSEAAIGAGFLMNPRSRTPRSAAVDVASVIPSVVTSDIWV